MPIDEALKEEAYWLYQATSKTAAIKRFATADDGGLQFGMEDQRNWHDVIIPCGRGTRPDRCPIGPMAMLCFPALCWRMPRISSPHDEGPTEARDDDGCPAPTLLGWSHVWDP